MPTWLILVFVAAGAAIVFALAWWSSGRARPGGIRSRYDGESLEVYRGRVD